MPSTPTWANDPNDSSHRCNSAKPAVVAPNVSTPSTPPFASSAAETAAQEAFGDEPPVPIEIDQGDKTYEELIAQRDEITELRDPLLDQGINITTWGPDEELNAVYVKVVDLTEDDEQTIHEALGDDVVVLMEDWPGNEEDAFSRTSDTSP